MISTTFAKGWFDGENGSKNYEYFPFFIRRLSYIYERQLYSKVVTAIKEINKNTLNNEDRKKLFSSAFDARLEILFLSGYFNYWSPNNPDQNEVIRFILDYLYAVNPSDPLGISGSYLPRTKDDIKDLINKDSFVEKNSNLIGQLIINVKALAWATTSETICMAKSIEGPYFVDNVNKFSFVRSYFSIKNPDIWPDSANYKFDRIDVCTVYERNKSNFGKLHIDFYGNYSTNFNLNNFQKAIILVDGKPLNSSSEIQELTGYISQVTMQQMDIFRNLPIKEQMKKLMELHYKVYKNLFILAGIDPMPTQEIYDLIERKDLKPKDEEKEKYDEDEGYDEFTKLTLQLIDDANFDNKYSRFIEDLSHLSLKGPSGIEFYGGKVTNLGILLEHHMNVPKGMVVTTETFKHFLAQNNLYAQIRTILKDIDVDNIHSLNKKSKDVADLIMNAELDSDVIKLICSKTNSETLVSVRSSATTEDLEGASFAGQLDSFLNVSTDNIIDSIKKCWVSLFSPRALVYRSKKGFSTYNVSMAVIIQEMIPSQVSGVVFTSNPRDNKDNNIILDASEGLGENVVSGKVTPDNVVVSRDLLNIEYVKSGTKKILLDEQIIDITTKSLHIEEIFGVPQDIEWAIYNNELFFLQARPITEKLHLKQTLIKNNGKILTKGVPVSEGVVEGNVCIIENFAELSHFIKGDILVASTTSPEFVVIMSQASGIITQHGGIASHAAIVSRELGIPCIVGCGEIFKKIKNNQRIVMDANTGKIYEYER
jgi:phosphohistidine swiveling domain-containing protein